MFKKDIYSKIINYGLKHPDGFIPQQAIEDLDLKPDGSDIKIFLAEINKEEIIKRIGKISENQKPVKGDDNLVVLTPNAKYQNRIERLTVLSLILIILSMVLSIFLYA